MYFSVVSPCRGVRRRVAWALGCACGVLALGAWFAGAAAAAPTPVCVSGDCTVTYTAGTGQSFTVPAGVSSLSLTLSGGAGGAAANTGGLSGSAGGDGATVTANLAVSGGETLGVDVGGAGAVGNSSPTGYAGGVNGGGASNTFNGAGGGATDVTLSGTELVVAGGGGGAGHNDGGSVSCPAATIFELQGGRGGDADSMGSPGQSATNGDDLVPGGAGGEPGTTSGVGTGGKGGVPSGMNAGCSPDQQYSGNTGASGSGTTGGGVGNIPQGGGGGGGYHGGGAGGAGASEAPGFINGSFEAAAGGGGGGASYGGGAGVSDYAVSDAGSTGDGAAIVSYTVITKLVAWPQLVIFEPFVGIGNQVVQATLTSGGSPLAGQTISFSDGSTALCNAVTNSEGIARCRISGLDQLLLNRNNHYTATFAATTDYSGSSSTVPAVAFLWF